MQSDLASTQSEVLPLFAARDVPTRKSVAFDRGHQRGEAKRERSAAILTKQDGWTGLP